MLTLLALLTACAPAHHEGGSTEAAVLPTVPSPSPAPAAEVTDPADLDWARAMNDPAGPQPLTIFRTGHIGARTLPESSVTRSPGRFEVRFPSGAPITTPAVYAGRVFTSGGFKGREFYALDARTGAPQWGRDLDDDGPSAPACEDGVCVFNTESCTVFALSAETGEQLWSWWMGDPMLSAPAIADGIVYTSYPAGALGYGGMNDSNNDNNFYGNALPIQQQQSADASPEVQGRRQIPAGATHVLAALDLKTGAIRWQRWLDGDVLSSPVVSDGAVHVTTFAGTLLTLTADEGVITAARRGQATSAPTVVGESVYWSQRSEAGGSAREALAGSGRGLSSTRFADGNERAAPYLDAEVQRQTTYAQGGQSLDAGNGFGGGAPASSGAAVAAGIVGQETVSRLQSFQGSKVIHAFDNNYASMGDEIVSTDPETGETRWSHRLGGDVATAGGSLAAPPAVAGGSLVIATLSGEVLLLDPETGREQRRLSVGAPIRSQPVVSDGWIYVGTEDGRLIGLDTGDPAMTGWPMWGGDAARRSIGG